MLPSNFPFHLYNWSTLYSEMCGDFLVVINYGKLSAKFFLGTTTVIDNYAKDGGPEVVWHLCSF